MLQPCRMCEKPFDTEDRELCCFCMAVDGMCTECLTKHEDACAEALELTPNNLDKPREQDLEDPMDHFEELSLKHKEVIDYADDYEPSGAEGLGNPAGDGGDCPGLANEASEV